MIVTITLTLAGSDTGPFNLYSDLDGYTTPFQTGVARSVLVAGLTTGTVPDGTTEILVQSTGTCDRDLYLTVEGAPGTTTTTTSTTSSTTTAPPVQNSTIINYGDTFVSGVLQKNGVTFTSFSASAYGSVTPVSLSGTTFNSGDLLNVVVSSFGATISVDNATISPEGGPLFAPTNYNNNPGTSVTLIFNGTGAGWGVNPMTWFNMTFYANTV